MLIRESGMMISCPDDDGFNLENSLAYKKSCSHDVSAVECVIRRKDNWVFFVEAKTTAPDRESGDDLLEYVNDIAAKYEHSVAMCYSIIHGVMPNDEGVPIGAKLKDSLVENPRIRFLLIVRNISEIDCIPLADKLNKKLKPILKIWGAEAVIVMSGSRAERKKLIKLVD